MAFKITNRLKFNNDRLKFNSDLKKKKDMLGVNKFLIFSSYSNKFLIFCPYSLINSIDQPLDF
jgi:hypothetical protein